MTVASLLVLSSCGTQSPMTGNLNQTQTSVVMSNANYKIVGSVSETVKQKYVLGMGGLSVKALKESAQSKMINKANLTGSQAIINTNVQSTVKMFTPIYIERTVTAYGTIIEFTK